MKQKFLKCPHCGNIVAMVKGVGVPVMCCGQAMEELVPNTTDAATEKHVPVYTVEGNKVVVTVSEVIHPMEEKHYIQWIGVETTNGIQIKNLTPDMEPKACFTLCESEKVEAVFEYCNLHGLWKA